MKIYIKILKNKKLNLYFKISQNINYNYFKIIKRLKEHLKVRIKIAIIKFLSFYKNKAVRN
jgi:hypothetical protein